MHQYHPPSPARGEALPRRRCGTRVQTLLLASLLVPATLLSLGAAPWTSSWDRIKTAAEGVRTIQADFVQEKRLPILSRPLQSKGTFVFSRPGSLRWEYRSPVQSLLLVDGDRVSRYVRQGGELKVDSSGQVEALRVVLGEISAWLAGRFDEGKTFEATLRPGAEAVVVVLTPRDPGLARMIQRIEVTLSKTPGLIESVRVVEGPEASTVIRFQNARLNEPLSAGAFEVTGE